MEKESYSVRSGTADVGKEYEVSITTLLSLRLCFNHEVVNFKASMNNQYWGDFDDSVLEVEYKDGTTKTVAVQLKHTGKNLSVENITSPSGDYSLDKYYKTYNGIKQNGGEDIYFVMYTTGGYSKNVGEFQWDDVRVRKVHNESFMDSLLKSPNNRNKLCSFQFVPSESCDEKSKFLSQFHIYTNQNNFDKTNHDIRDIIDNKYLYADDISKELLAFVNRWSKGQLGGHYKLTKNDLIIKLSELLLSPYVAEPSFNCEVFTHLKLWEKSIRCVDVVIVSDFNKTKSAIWFGIFEAMKQFICEESCNRETWIKPSIPVNKIKNSLPISWVMEKVEGTKMSLKSLYIVCWKTGLVPLFLQSTEESDCKAISNILDLCSTTQLKKYFIINIKKENEEKYFDKFSKLTCLEDLRINEEVFNEAMRKTSISIQNRFEIALEGLQDLDSDFAKNITTELFLKMLQDQVVVGKTNIADPVVYIERNVSKIHVQLDAVKYIKDTTFLLCDPEDYPVIKTMFSSEATSLEDYSAGNSDNKSLILVMNEIPMETLQTVEKNYHVFRLKRTYKHYKPYNLEWIKSRAPLDLLRHFEDDPTDNTKESKLFTHFNSIHVISAAPGMGKSTLINKLFKVCPDDYWAIKIDLNKHSRYFNQQENRIEPLEYFYSQSGNSRDVLTRICFDSFIKAKRLFFFMDGFDEVSPRFTERVLNVIRDFKDNGYIQWITTRPVTAAILEDEFYVMSSSICPFTSEDQQEYIQEFFKKLPGFDDGEILDAFMVFIQNSVSNWGSDFASIPLQIYMLCEALKHYSCEEIKNRESMDIVELYENFVNSKFFLYEEKFFKDCDAAVYDLLEETRKNSKLQHHKLSLLLLFGKDVAKELVDKNTEEFLSKVKDGKEKTGIIVDVNDYNEPIFAHRTYAEFLSASWLATNWKDEQSRKLILLLFDEDKSMIRLLFDKIVAQKNKVFEAVLNQNLNEVKSFTREDFDRVDEVGRNVLHLACSWGPRYNTPRQSAEAQNIWKKDHFIKSEARTMLQITEFLLQIEVNPKSKCDLLQFSPSQYADKVQNIPAIDRILEVDQDIDITSLEICSNFNSLLYYVVKYQHINILRKLTTHFEPNSALVSTQDEQDSLLHVAVESGNATILKTLLSTETFKNHINDQDKHGNTALHWAILQGQTGVVKELINSGADFRLTKRGNSPYQLAIEQSHDEIKEILADAGAKTVETQEIHPIHDAALQGNLDEIRQLLSEGADVNELDYIKRAAIHCAAMRGHAEVVKFLITEGAVVDEVDDYGGTPLNWACGEGHTEVVKCLLKAGVDANKATKDGVTPLMNAAGEGHVKVVERLIEDKAVKLNVQNHYGGTALHYAAWRGRLEITKLLVEAGANLYLTNKSGETPLQEAYQHKHMDIVKYLLPFY